MHSPRARRTIPIVVAALLAMEASYSGTRAEENDAYDGWNRFCLEHFGAEKEPLVYELFGKELKVPADGIWVHASEASACVAWETTLPARTSVEYGESEKYGRKTPEPERPFYIHVHYLRDLKPGTTYHYRLVSVDERGNRIASNDATFSTRTPEGAIRVPGESPGTPCKLDRPGTTYILTKDLTAPGAGIEILGDGITLDLGGRTVTFAQGADKEAAGIAARGDERTKIKYQASGLRIVNGAVVQGTSPAVAANKKSEAFNCLHLVGADIELAGVTVDYRAPQAWGAILGHPSGAIDVHHNVFVDRGTQIADRHGLGVRPFGFTQQAREKNSFRVHHNLVKRTRQNGLHGAWDLSHNEICVDSWSTNSFALQPNSIPDVEAGDVQYNRVLATGFNPYGLGWAHRRLKVHHNLVHMHGIDAKSRWGERWGDISMCEGFRVTNYGKGGQKRDDLEYWNNLIVIRGAGGSELRGTGFFSDDTIRDLVFRDNTVKIESLDEQTNTVACVSTHGQPEKADTCLPVVYRGCTLLSNVCHVRFGDSYGKGSNHQFIGCRFVRTGNDPRYHTFVFDGAFWSRRHVILDCEFGEGTRYDDVLWEKTASTSSYSVKWTLTVKTAPGAKVTIRDKDGNEEFSGTAGADGVVSAPLTQCILRPKEWAPGVKGGGGEVKLRSEHQEILCTPHTVTAEKDGKTATRTAEMRGRRTLEADLNKE